MQGEGTSRNFSFSGTSGKKAMGMRGHPDNVIIDVDDDNVVIIDVPDTFQPKPKRSPIQNIIHIDDDESHYADHSEISGEDDSDLDSDETPRTSPALRSEYAGADDRRAFRGKVSAFKLATCKNMYTNKPSPRNRYGLGLESESDSESGSSDCEVIEGSSSELREQWEKVCLKKKSNSYDKGLGLQDQVSPCSSQTDTQPNAKMGNQTKQNSEDPGCSRGNKLNFQEGSSFDFLASEDGCIGGSFNPWIDVAFAEADDFPRLSKPKSRNSASQWKSDVRTSEQSCRGNGDFQCASRLNDRFDSCGHSPRSIHRSNKKVIGTRSCFQHNKQRTVGEGSSKCPVVKHNLDSDKRCSDQDHDKDASLCKNQVSRVMHSLNPTRIFSEIDSEFSEATSIRNIRSDERRCEILGSNVKDKLSPGTPSYVEGHNSLNKLISNGHDGNNSLDASAGDVILAQNDIINEKERLKETDDYKRAVEEEWAARKLQLKIQAEEAKRLKKRRKAETLRILDMEKRQKQRVEEVRETQRKDEENLNMKEHLRAEIRRELDKLESTSTDMASLLRGLGIHVEGGFRPLSQEVNAAYKRALLKFHPDRASRSDIRQQVEAEEKFKLISRMKEKFFH